MAESLPLFPQSSTELAEKVISIIATHSAQHPASIAYLQDRTGLSDRAVKQIVEQARLSGSPICARRGTPHGYFWANTAEELEASAAVMISQARKMLLAAGKLIAKHRLREMLGQDVFEGGNGD